MGNQVPPLKKTDLNEDLKDRQLIAKVVPHINNLTPVFVFQTLALKKYLEENPQIDFSVFFNKPVCANYYIDFGLCCKVDTFRYSQLQFRDFKSLNYHFDLKLEKDHEVGFSEEVVRSFGLEIDPDKPRNLNKFYFRKIRDSSDVPKDNNRIEEGYVD